MKTSTTPHKTILALLSVALIAVSGMKAQVQQESHTSAPQGTNSYSQGNWHHHKAELAVLSEAEREQLKSDMKQIKDNPQLAAARQVAHDATTPEAKQAAHKALKETRRQLLMQVDPNVQPILDKLEQAHKQHLHHHGGNAEGVPTPGTTPTSN
jgi:hypothetical protein